MKKRILDRGTENSLEFPIVLIVGPKLFNEMGTKAFSNAFERERPRIVNNFAPSASPDYDFSSF